MSRFTGPRLKVMRSLGVDLPGLSRKSIEQRPTPPGQHGAKVTRKRQSDFGAKLQEKQKLRFNYGLTERQMCKMILSARKGNMPTGDHFLQLLERRLDNVVFRAGFAPTILAARQLVLHCHVLLNGRVANIPSIQVSVGDEISVNVTSIKMFIVMESLEKPALARPDWLNFVDAEKGVCVSRLPEAEHVPFPVDMQQVVEFYSNRV